MPVSRVSSVFRREPVGFEYAINRVIESCQPVEDAPLGERDRTEQKVLEQLRSIHDLMSEPFDEEAWLADWRRGRDYQRDHPLSAVDGALDEAFVPDHAYAPDHLVGLRGALDPRSIDRLVTYSVRCCSRALATKRCEVAHAGLRALAWSVLAREHPIDARDDMVLLAPFVVTCRALSSDNRPLRLLVDLAAADPTFSALAESFGQRSDVTLNAFGYKLLATDHGDWIVGI